MLAPALILTAMTLPPGAAFAQSDRKVAVRPGDVVWIRPGVKHWHGASSTSAVAHIAIAEALDGQTVDWGKHASDQQYGR